MKLQRTVPVSSPRGFSLIELLIVIAIILVIAGLAIPSFLRSKMRANEAAVVGALRSVTAANETYQSTYARGYAPDFPSLAPPPAGTPPSASAANLLDPVLAAGSRNGYTFIYTPVDTDSNGQFDQYTVNANPVQVGSSGEKFFYVDHTNVIRENLGGPADKNSPPVPKN
jgi:prepilin-type N-terminal cleavage/methylation domain-containing protein